MLWSRLMRIEMESILNLQYSLKNKLNDFLMWTMLFVLTKPQRMIVQLCSSPQFCCLYIFHPIVLILWPILLFWFTLMFTLSRSKQLEKETIVNTASKALFPLRRWWNITWNEGWIWNLHSFIKCQEMWLNEHRHHSDFAEYNMDNNIQHICHIK